MALHAEFFFSLEISIFYKYLCACGPVRLIGFTTFCLLAAFPGNRFICYLEFCRPSESNIFIKRAVNVSKGFRGLVFRCPHRRFLAVSRVLFGIPSCLRILWGGLFGPKKDSQEIFTPPF